jgi:D-2-hydroxyacid dehydrogenase (NADP+)
VSRVERPREPVHVLIFLPWDESERFLYERIIVPRFPGLSVQTVGTLDELMAHIGRAEILMSFGVRLPRGIFAHAPRLKWVHAFGTGVDGIADQKTLGRDVLITSTKGIHGPPVAEAALASMLALSRDLPRSVRAQDLRAWDKWRMRLLDRKTVGILGVGSIAQALAPRCQAMGMTVVGISRSPRPVVGFDRVVSRNELERVVRDVDYLVLLLPLEPDTRHIVGDRVLAAMKPTGYLINVARGGVLDDAALVRALEAKKLAGAALDVFDQEPLPIDHPFWRMPNVIITPHFGGYYDRYVEDSADQVCRNLERFLAGRVADMENVAART